MLVRKLTCSLFVSLSICFCAKSENLSKIDFSYLYDFGPVKVQHQIAKSGEEYHLALYFNLRKIKLTDPIRNFRIFSQQKFDDKNENNIELISNVSDSIESVVRKRMTFQLLADQNHVVVSFTFLEKDYVYFVPVNGSLKFPICDLSIENLSDKGQRLMEVGEELVVGTPAGDQFYIYEYSENFPAATPPMVEPDQTNESLEIENLMLKRGSFQVDQVNKLYLLQSDSSSNAAISIISIPSYYPKFKTASELIAPLVYLCSSSEFEALQGASDQKKAFTDFWINLLKSKDLASKTIKLYYDRIKQANAYFSNHKIGWKTDQGMVYIAFGPPNEVQRKENVEIWSYDTFDGKLKLTFVRLPNLFVQYHYQLEREGKLSSHWFRAIKSWRRGNI